MNGGTEVLPSFWELLPARQDNRKAVPAMSSRPDAELKGSKPIGDEVSKAKKHAAEAAPAPQRRLPPEERIWQPAANDGG